MLDKFEIKSSLIAHIGSYSYDGDCWQAELVEKGTNGKIIYDLTMAIEEKITPLKKFIDKKDELKYFIKSFFSSFTSTHVFSFTLRSAHSKG